MRRESVYLIIIIIVAVSVNITAAAAWVPEEPRAFYSREDRPVFVQIAYGNLINEPVFIPFNSKVIPSPVFYVIMGGLSEYDIKEAYLTVYSYNTTAHAYTDVVDHPLANFTLSINHSLSEFFAIRRITLELNNSQNYRCEFDYLDIHAEFYYKPDPIYVTLKTDQFFLYGWGLLMIVLTTAVIIAAAIAGKMIQRRGTVVPGIPVLEILGYVFAMLSFAVMIIFMQFPYQGVDLVIHLLVGNTVFLIFPLEFPIFVLWFAHRHSEENLLKLQIDLSRFDPAGEDEVDWLKDLQDSYRCYWYKGELMLLKDPESWKDFFKRLAGFHVRLGNYQQSMKPDKGYWNDNDRRVFISCSDIVDFDGGFSFRWNLTVWPVVLSAVALGLLFLGAGDFLHSWVSLLLMVAGLGLFILLYPFRNAIFYVGYEKGNWWFKVNKYQEAEMILTSQQNFLRLQNDITNLQTKYNDAIANQELNTTSRVEGYISVINDKILQFKGLLGKEKEEENGKNKEEKKNVR